MASLKNFATVAIISVAFTISLAVYSVTFNSTLIATTGTCRNTENKTNRGSDKVLFTFHKQYLQAEKCAVAATVPNLTKPRTIYLFIVVSLTLAGINVAASAVLVMAIKSKNYTKYIAVVLCIYTPSYIFSFLWELTLICFLIIDYVGMSAQLDVAKTGLPENYSIDALRGSIVIVTIIVSKGFIPSVVNLLLIGVMIKYYFEYLRARGQERERNTEMAMRRRNSMLYSTAHIMQLLTMSSMAGTPSSSLSTTPERTPRVLGDITRDTNSDSERSSTDSPLPPPRRRASRRSTRSTVSRSFQSRSSAGVRHITSNANEEFEMAHTGRAISKTEQRLPITVINRLARSARSGSSLHASNPLALISNYGVEDTAIDFADFEGCQCDFETMI